MENLGAEPYFLPFSSGRTAPSVPAGDSRGLNYTMEYLLSLGILCSSCDNPSSDTTSLPISISEADGVDGADGAGVGDNFLLRLNNGILITNCLSV